MRSRVLPVRFVVREAILDVLDATTGELLNPLRAQELHLQEEITAREQATAARQQEAAARQVAEEELDRLRAELDHLRKEREADT